MFTLQTHSFTKIRKHSPNIVALFTSRFKNNVPISVHHIVHLTNTNERIIFSHSLALKHVIQGSAITLNFKNTA